MNNGNETLGLNIISTSPEAHMSNANVNSNIEITFSADVNPLSFQNNIVVFEDYKNVYTKISDLKNYTNFNIVKGTISYKDRVLTFKPEVPFNINMMYIVMLNNGIKDIVGNILNKKFVFAFRTESVASNVKAEFIYPTFGTIVNKMPTFQWKNQFTETYIFQMSKTNTFEVLLEDIFVPGKQESENITYTPNIKVNEGVYYVRVKSENGEWSDPLQFFYKEITDAVVSMEDTPDSIYLEDFLSELEEPLEVLEFFPNENSLNVSLKTNIIYIKIKGEINQELVKFDDCYVVGEPFDEEDNSEDAHGYVNGTWSAIYDSELDVTYVIFTPVAITTEEEQSYIDQLYPAPAPEL